MQLHDYTIKVKSRFDPVTIWFVGDCHVGAAGFAREKLKTTVKEIADNPNAYFVGMGDYCDHIGFRDPRFDPAQIDPSYRIADLKKLAEKQLRDFTSIMNPIRDKCIGWLEGNHEEKWQQHYHYSPTYYLQDWSGGQSKALSYSAIITIGIQDADHAKRNKIRYEFDAYVHHGYGGARTDGADLKKVMDLVASVDADVYAMGHGHKLLTDGYSVVAKRKTRGHELATQEKPKAFFLTGSYLMTLAVGDSGYAERKCYKPTLLGSPNLVVRMKKIAGIEELEFKRVA
jgi:hypothetical protein